MEVKDARCTNCGASLKVEPQKTITTCEYCHSDILISGAIELALVEVDKTKDIAKTRENLRNAIKHNHIEEIKRLSQRLKDLMPNDFEASYFLAYAFVQKNNPSLMKAFYRYNGPITSDERQRVIPHMIQRSDLRDKNEVIQFLNQHAPDQVETYQETHESRKNQEDQYASIPRDVFICFSSKGQALAESALREIEKNGFTAWISTRNLRPEDNENYWDNIETAIKNAKVMVVISSEAAMLSKDVQNEINIARNLNKPLFEYKIDNVPHTALFKYIFNGIKWVEGFDNPRGSLNKIPTRIVEVFETNRFIKASKPKKEKEHIKPKEPNLFILNLKSKFKIINYKMLVPLVGLISLIIIASLNFNTIYDFFTQESYEVEDNIVVDFFVGEDNSNTVQSITNMQPNSLIPKPDTPTRPGFDFDGWFSDINLTEPWDFENEIVNTNITLYAKWIRKTFNVIYDLNGGEIIGEDYTTDFQTGDYKTLPIARRVGFNFVSWYPYDWVDETSTIPGDSGLQRIPLDQTEDLYLYAHWVLINVRVSFNTNYPVEREGPEQPNSTTVSYGEVIDFPILEDNDDYVFMGWNSASDGSGTWYVKGELFLRTQNLILYAIWQR